MGWKNTTITIGAMMLCGAACIALTAGKHSVQPTRAAADPAPKTVAVVKVERANLARTVAIEAEMRPWEQINVHAKVSGFLKTINVDIGDQVKKGQVLATLEIPEQAQDEANAQADYTVAKLNFDRIETVIKQHPGLLAQQEVDDAQGKYEQAKAAYQRTKILSAYATITAPFDGVITKRSADPGALVQAGTSSDTQSLPIVHLADIYKLRLDFPAPEEIVPQMHVGMPVTIVIHAANETLQSKVARMSESVDPSTRTMIVEVDIDNRDLKLKPGMYAEATIPLAAKTNVLAAPMQAVVMGKHPEVWVVDKNNIVQRRAVTLGIRTPDKIQITNGVSAGDLLIFGEHENLANGMKVAPQLVPNNGLE
ncbi:MAG: efflux RND transporter periplasmic adaptor subunit [Syntrophobacteraceae bacterium]